MEKPSGYDSVEPKNFGGSFETVKPGAYIGKVLRAAEDTSSNNNQMLVLSLDIVDGEYSDFYKNLSIKLDTNKLLKHRRVINTPGSMPYFKGDIKSIEQSNTGYLFDFNVNTLVGKNVGIVLGEEEYEKNGEVKTALKINFLCSVEKVRSGTIKTPEKRLLDNSQQSQSSFSNEKVTTSPQYDDDLPF